MIWVKILFVSLTKFQPKAFFNFNFNQIASRTPNSSMWLHALVWLHAGYLHMTWPNLSFHSKLMTYDIKWKGGRTQAAFT